MIPWADRAASYTGYICLTGASMGGHRSQPHRRQLRLFATRLAEAIAFQKHLRAGMPATPPAQPLSI